MPCICVSLDLSYIYSVLSGLLMTLFVYDTVQLLSDEDCNIYIYEKMLLLIFSSND